MADAVELPLSDMSSGNVNLTAEPADWIFQKLGTPTEDPRLKDWLFMSSPWPTLALTVAYLIMCNIGPGLMRDRKAWDLKAFIIIYNFCLVLLSLYMSLEIIAVTFMNPNFGNLGCAPMDFSDDSKSHRLLSVIWIYYFSKLIEFTETLVFILRKKNNQISFLHVYHHSSMFVLWWLTVKHCGGGSVLMNSMVHTVMYSYYMLSAIGESMRPYIWWKKYLTRLQLMQFWVVTLHILYTIYSNCGYPRGYAWLLVIYMFTQKALFMNFYMSTYRKPKSKAVGHESASNSSPRAKLENSQSKLD